MKKTILIKMEIIILKIVARKSDAVKKLLNRFNPRKSKADKIRILFISIKIRGNTNCGIFFLRKYFSTKKWIIAEIVVAKANPACCRYCIKIIFKIILITTIKAEIFTGVFVSLFA